MAGHNLGVTTGDISLDLNELAMVVLFSLEWEALCDSSFYIVQRQREHNGYIKNVVMRCIVV